MKIKTKLYDAKYQDYIKSLLDYIEEDVNREYASDEIEFEIVTGRPKLLNTQDINILYLGPNIKIGEISIRNINKDFSNLIFKYGTRAAIAQDLADNALYAFKVFIGSLDLEENAKIVRNFYRDFKGYPNLLEALEDLSKLPNGDSFSLMNDYIDLCYKGIGK